MPVYLPGWVGCAGYVVGCAGYVVRVAQAMWWSDSDYKTNLSSTSTELANWN